MSKYLLCLTAVFSSAFFVGCASPVANPRDGSASVSQFLFDVVVESSNSASVTLNNTFWSNDANNLKVADSECNKYGKVAQFVERDGERIRYNCVRP